MDTIKENLDENRGDLNSGSSIKGLDDRNADLVTITITGEFSTETKNIADAI
jgi:hypothetical protein